MAQIFLHRNDKKSTYTRGELFGLIGSDLMTLSFNQVIKKGYNHINIEVISKFCEVKKGDNPFDALYDYGKIYSGYKTLKKRASWIELKQKPGQYFERIYRPILVVEGPTAIRVGLDIETIRKEFFQFPQYLPVNIETVINSVNQLGILKDMLQNIFNNIYPSSKNLETFGNNLKNLLVLACIEVETQLKGILTANSYPQKQRYNTTDFVKLKEILHLDKYAVTFPFYPNLKSIAPFKNWDSTSPTHSLKWYDSYNSIKHNGDLDFYKATLNNAISAICAVAILIKAQYGASIPFWDERLGSFFNIKETVNWKLEERILPPFENENWFAEKMVVH